ncbi:hypothetical protein DMENIID0001_042540 [Sergentomyia squamirostris]
MEEGLRFPLLKELAISVLGVPMSSASSERNLSAAGRLMAPKRALLSSVTEIEEDEKFKTPSGFHRNLELEDAPVSMNSPGSHEHRFQSLQINDGNGLKDEEVPRAHNSSTTSCHTMMMTSLQVICSYVTIIFSRNRRCHSATGFSGTSCTGVSCTTTRSAYDL